MHMVSQQWAAVDSSLLFTCILFTIHSSPEKKMGSKSSINQLKYLKMSTVIVATYTWNKLDTSSNRIYAP